jgi:hypothetical protein
LEMPDNRIKEELRAVGAGICTLFEGNYHLGLAAFLNATARAGYRGTIWAGYRGMLPPWLNQLKRASHDADEYWIADQVRLVFLKLDTQLHFTNYKPDFMLRLLADEARNCDYLWYFDPDVFLTAKWPFFAEWQRFGIALCQEVVDNIFPADNPLRQQWVEHASCIGFENPRPIDCYYNGGLVGVPASSAGFLESWKSLIAMVATTGFDLRYLNEGNREQPFHVSDQDALNIAAMYSKFPLTTLGPQGMGFVPGGIMMYHAVGHKPWNGSLLLRALKGMPPTGAAKFYFTLVDAPIRVYSPLRLRAKRIACSIAAFIGRSYSRR